MSVCSLKQNAQTRHNVAIKYPFLIIFSKASFMTSALHLAVEESKKKSAIRHDSFFIKLGLLPHELEGLGLFLNL